ncbi:MAG: phosphotransferase [Eubacteriales bacterium]
MIYNEIIGKGAQATVYKVNNYALKIFNKNYKKSGAFYEALITSVIEESGLPIAKIHEVIDVDGHIAIKMDYIQGSSFYNIMENDKKNIGSYINQMADLQILIHSKLSPSLFKLKDKLRAKIQGSQISDSAKKEKLLKILSDLPDSDSLCHGDFHPKNIIVNDDRLYIIDWIDAFIGCPAGDVCRTYMLFCFYLPEIAEAYLTVYCSKTGTAREKVLEWLPVVAAARLSENFPLETEKINAWLNSI